MSRPGQIKLSVRKRQAFILSHLLLARVGTRALPHLRIDGLTEKSIAGLDASSFERALLTGALHLRKASLRKTGRQNLTTEISRPICQALYSYFQLLLLHSISESRLISEVERLALVSLVGKLERGLTGKLRQGGALSREETTQRLSAEWKDLDPSLRHRMKKREAKYREELLLQVPPRIYEENFLLPLRRTGFKLRNIFEGPGKGGGAWRFL